MGWQDRDYGRQGGFGGGRFSNPLMNLLFGSVPLGTLFGIRIRVHATLVLLIVLELLFAGSQYGLGIERTAIDVFVLFTIILLHEFGHCFAARIMGGEADDILLWPLGGLAYARPPHRPWASFVTYAGGPLVNVLICIVTGTMLYFMGVLEVSWLNPMLGFSGKLFMTRETYNLISPTHLVGWLFWFFTWSASLFFFNLLPIFPMDGGGLLNAILWKPLGYRKAMNISCITGMIGAGLGFMLGLVSLNFMLIMLAIAGFMTCRNMRLMLKMSEEEEGPQYDLSAAWDDPAAQTKRRKRKKRWFRSARKRATKDQAEQAKIDLILVKVKEKGLHSLSWWEKRTLKKATARQRQQDLAERL